MRGPRFFAPSASDPQVTLGPDESHHLVHVLRLGVGATVSVFDGRGGEWAAEVAAVGKRDVRLDRRDPIVPVGEPPVRVVLGVGLLKGDHMDEVVRDATMLGVQAIAPCVSDHVVVPSRIWRGEAALGRWRRVAIASARQCGRAVVPAIEPAVSFDELLDRANVDVRLVAVEPGAPGAATVEPASLGKPSAALALVGPEGGWSAAEIDRARARGATLVRLGPRTLRADAAPTVLLAALWTSWGWGG